MLTQLIDHNEDLKKLKAEGYNISIINNHLVVDGIPYVNENKAVLFGSIFCPFNLLGNNRITQKDHTVYFTGEHPCNQFGIRDNSFVNSTRVNKLTDGIIGKLYFSSKPSNGSYPDFYEKMKRYVDLLSTPAKSINPSVSALNFEYKAYNQNLVFKYPDTHTARAEISSVNDKVKNQKVAIIGLGGTGSYLLDFISKTPVAEISIFDGDELLNHNAFRIPGAVSLEDFQKRPIKVDYLKGKYDEVHSGIVAYPEYMDESNVHVIKDMDFVFLSIDDSGAKKIILEFLIQNQIPFVDLGMGITKFKDSLRGTIRTTLITPQDSSAIDKISVENTEDENVYSQNIQIGELNALNAALGVMTWKKYFGYYSSEETIYNSVLVLDEGEFNNEA